MDNLGGNTFEEFENADGVEYFGVGIDQRSDVAVALSCRVEDLVDVGQGVMLPFLCSILVVSDFQQGALENGTVQFTAVWTQG